VSEAPAFSGAPGADMTAIHHTQHSVDRCAERGIDRDVALEVAHAGGVDATRDIVAVVEGNMIVTVMRASDVRVEEIGGLHVRFGLASASQIGVLPATREQLLAACVGHEDVHGAPTGALRDLDRRRALAVGGWTEADVAAVRAAPGGVGQVHRDARESVRRRHLERKRDGLRDALRAGAGSVWAPSELQRVDGLLAEMDTASC
jgi:hypothetical protein